MLNQDRRAEYAEVPWQQGALLMTRMTMSQSPEWRAEADVLEKRMVFAHFSPLDDGRSRVFLHACETADEAAEMVRVHNYALYRLAQKQKFLELVRHRSLPSHD